MTWVCAVPVSCVLCNHGGAEVRAQQMARVAAVHGLHLNVSPPVHHVARTLPVNVCTMISGAAALVT